MRRFFLFVTSLILIFALAVSANAAPAASKISYFATVTGDSRCQVNMNVTLRITDAGQELQFPIPANAGGIAVNGRRVFTSRDGDKRYLSLNRIIGKSTGEITFTVSYTLPDVVHTSELGILEVQLPMLSGLSCPVEHFEFSVTMPSTVDALPGFSSGYHQAGIEEYMTYQVTGNTVTGSSTAQLKDHETLSMDLTVSDTVFSQGLRNIQDWSGCITAMVICGILALAYWLFTLRFLPLRRQRCTELPDGYTAGELGSILHLQGMDVTMTVLSWAKLGYIMLEADRSGRVRLHKRMEMGNERKESERKLFRALFARRSTVDTAGSHYAQLCLDTARKSRGLTELVRKRSGNPKVFQILAAGIGLFGGVCLAIIIGDGALLQGLLILLLGLAGGVSGYYIQTWGRCLTVQDPARMIACFALCGLWLLLSLIAGVFSVGLGMVLGLLAAGWLLAWSGRRTEHGKILAAQISGLRKYLSAIKGEQLHHLITQDPDYFFTLVPSAIALGQAKNFSRHFGKLRMESCPYLVGIKAGSGTAAEWMQLLQKCVRSMNSRAQKRPLETLTRLIQSLLQLIPMKKR